MNFDKLVEIARALMDWERYPKLRTFHVSFLMRRTRIVAIGINVPKTHPVNLRNPKHNREGVDISDIKYQCAEWVAMRQSKQQNVDYNKCKLISIRIDRTGKLCNSCPCLSCQSLLKHFGVGRVYFTNDKGEFEEF